MAGLPEGLAQFEFHKMQLIGSLGAVADTMRNCAAIADQFSQLLSPLQYAPPIHSNGQFAVPALPPLLASGRGKRKAGEEGEGHKAKRVRKPKDPNAPKRPASSYLLFQNEIRQDLKAKNPSMPNNELLGLIAKMWKEMSPEEKDTYEARQRLAKDQWLADKNAYKASKDAAASEEPVAASPSSEVLEVPVAKPALVEETSDTSGESSTDAGEESGASSPETSDDEEEKVAATLKKSKKRTPALSSPVPATPAKARKSRSKP